jgi:hypothetical protein
MANSFENCSRHNCGSCGDDMIDTGLPKMHDRPLQLQNNSGMSARKANFNDIKARIAALFKRLEIETDGAGRIGILRTINEINAGLGRQCAEGRIETGHAAYLMEMIELGGKEPKINPKHYVRPKELYMLND